MEQTATTRIHRVGSITTGIVMIAAGVLFLLCSVFNLMSYETVFKFWPIILILLGLELLWCNAGGKNLVYDKGAIALLFLLSLFSMGMAAANLVFTEFYHCIH